MAGIALTGPIFQRAQSKTLALYVHRIILFSASCDTNGAKIGIINGLLALVLLMILL